MQGLDEGADDLLHRPLVDDHVPLEDCADDEAKGEVEVKVFGAEPGDFATASAGSWHSALLPPHVENPVASLPAVAL